MKKKKSEEPSQFQLGFVVEDFDQRIDYLDAVAEGNFHVLHARIVELERRLERMEGFDRYRDMRAKAK